MLNSNILSLHTVTPHEIPVGHDEKGYRHVVGVEYAGRAVWLPGDHERATRSDFEIPKGDLGVNVLDYVKVHYGPEARGRYRNCHLGAAAMTGIVVEKEYQAASAASGIVRDGEPVADLAVGQWGAIGGQWGPIGDREWGAYHSMVGIAPGLALQTDRQNGLFSLVDTAQHVEHYRQAHDPTVALYAVQASRHLTKPQ